MPQNMLTASLVALELMSSGDVRVARGLTKVVQLRQHPERKNAAESIGVYNARNLTGRICWTRTHLKNGKHRGGVINPVEPAKDILRKVALSPGLSISRLAAS